MVLNLKPAATALAALLAADPLQLTAAERSRREQLLGGEANNAKKKTEHVLDAEFHRAMLAKPARANASRGGNSRQKFAEQPRIQRLLANIRRKRALTGTVQRGVNNHVGGGAAGKAPPATTAVKPQEAQDMLPEEYMEEDELLELLECGGDLEDASAADAGLLNSQECDDGYRCVASNASSLGGLCIPTTSTATGRSLQAYTGYGCPAGCPAKVCECYESYDLESAECIDALVDACRDGSYVSSCGATDPLSQAYAQAYCDAYVCLADSGLDNAIAGDSVCDTADAACADCYCTLYSSLCNIFRPLCQQGSDAYVCYDIDYVCDMSDCCDQLGSAECINAYGGGSDMPTATPFLPSEGPSSGASDLLLSGGGRYALLGASAVAAGLAQTLL
jgi:hypothetical protein